MVLKFVPRKIRFWLLSSSLLRKKPCRLLILILIFILIFHIILLFERDSGERKFGGLDIDIPDDFKPIRVTAREPLPTMGVSKVPKIIHQTWKNTKIPPAFVRWIKSWLHFHPDWEYWLWTDDSAEKLIADKYPHLLDVYNGYLQPIRRADALRYVVLYEYGGVYADMDMESLAPLDPLAMKYSCFIGQEPFEHPVMDTNVDLLVINALIGCRKEHPFMKLLIDKLPYFAHMWNCLDSTGPHFVTFLYKEYSRESQLSAVEDDAVYLTPSEYFYPTIDPDKVDYMLQMCQAKDKLSRLQYKACMNLKYKQLGEHKIDPLSFAFTNHHWSHTYLKSLPFSFSLIFKDTPIHDICPYVHIYNYN